MTKFPFKIGDSYIWENEMVMGAGLGTMEPMHPMIRQLIFVNPSN